MVDYDYYAPTRVIFDKGRHEEIGQVLAGYGLKKALLVYGGGSVIDTCKGIAMGVSYQGDVWDLCDGTATVTGALLVSAVLTIPGTGSETSRNVVLTNEETNEKLGAMQPCLRPLVSILDPTLCTTIPPRVAAPGIYDMLSHNMERYMTETSHADTILAVGEGVMRSILRNGPRVHETPRTWTPGATSWWQVT